MSEKTREKLGNKLAAKQQLLDMIVGALSEHKSTHDYEWMLSEASNAVDCARTIARIARRLAKAGAQ
jgi:hypothetical protein